MSIYTGIVALIVPGMQRLYVIANLLFHRYCDRGQTAFFLAGAASKCHQIATGFSA